MLSPICHMLHCYTVSNLATWDRHRWHKFVPYCKAAPYRACGIKPYESSSWPFDISDTEQFGDVTRSLCRWLPELTASRRIQTLRTAKQRTTKYKLMVRSVKAARNGHGLLELWQSKHRISANNLTRVQNLVVSLRMYFSLRFISRPSSSFTQPSLADLVGMYEYV